MRSYSPSDEPIPGYRLIEQLGQGSFGVVWKAEGPGGVLVALKIISNLNGIHAIREWQSLQNVMNLKQANLVEIYGVWLKNEESQVLRAEEVRALIPPDVDVGAAPVTETPSTTPSAPRRSVWSGEKKPAKPAPPAHRLESATLQSDDEPQTADAQVGSTAADSNRPAEAGSAAAELPDGAKNSATLKESAGSKDSTGSKDSGSSGSKGKWSKAGGVPPLELVSAMTLGEGTLMVRLKQCQAQGSRGIPRPELLQYMREAAKGLQFLNGRAMHHCDVKPENLLLVGGSVKVCDYGSALRTIYSTESRTHQGYTEQYAAPEQLSGRRVKLHASTDLYALALTYYALRTGKYPWGDLSSEPISVLKYNEKFDFSALAKLSRYPYEWQVIRRALKRDPAERFASTTEFIETLEKAVRREEEATRARRRRRIRNFALLAAAVLLLGVGTTAWLNPQAIPFPVFRGGSAFDALARLIDEGDLEGAIKLANATPDLAGSESAAELLFGELTKLGRDDPRTALHLASGMDGELLDSKSRNAFLDAVVINSPEHPVGAAFQAGDFKAAIEACRQAAAEVPAGFQASVSDKIFAKWREAIDAEGDPVPGAQKLVQLATAFPDEKNRGQVRPDFIERLRRGLQAAESKLDGTAAELEASEAAMQQLAASAASWCGLAGEPAGEVQSLWLQARLGALAAAVVSSKPAEPSESLAGWQAAAKAMEAEFEPPLAAHPELRARLDLLLAVTQPGQPQSLLSAATIDQLVKIEGALRSDWERRLFSELERSIFNVVAANVATGSSPQILEALGRLAPGRELWLKMAATLLVKAARGDGDGVAELTKARDCLQNVPVAAGEKDQAKAALSAWIDLLGAPQEIDAPLQVAIGAFQDWALVTSDKGLSQDAIPEFFASIVRLVERRQDSGQSTVEQSIDSTVERLRGLLPKETDAPWTPWQALSAEAELLLRMRRIRIAAQSSGLALADLETIQKDAQDARWLEKRIQRHSPQSRLPGSLQRPLGERELAALLVEAELIPAALDGSIAKAALSDEAKLALEELANVESPVNSGAQSASAQPPSGPPDDDDYLVFVTDLGVIRGLISGTEGVSPLHRPLDSESAWLQVPLRRRAAAAELRRKATQGLELPPRLKLVGSAARGFANSAGDLDAALRWLPTQESAEAAVLQAWLAVCRMYGSADADWKAIFDTSAAALEVPAVIDTLDAGLRFHLWLAHARAGRSLLAQLPSARADSIRSFAKILEQEYDPFYERGAFVGRDMDLNEVAFEEVIDPAHELLRDYEPQSRQDASSAAIIRGAYAAALENDASRDLADKHFEYASQPRRFVEAMRDEFHEAARLEADPDLRLRWLTGEARAADFLLSQLDAEVVDFSALETIGKTMAEKHGNTFPHLCAQGFVHHYKSRIVPTRQATSVELASAKDCFTKAISTLNGHPRLTSPWCQSWLAQIHESLSMVNLEQSWSAPWGVEKQRLLQQAVIHAETAQQITEAPRLDASQAYFCAGNAYEDLALHLHCVGYFDKAKDAFESAGNHASEILKQKAEMSVGRILFRQALNAPDFRDDPRKRQQSRERAMERLDRAARSLRQIKQDSLGLAREAEFYLADVYQNLPAEFNGGAKLSDDQYRKQRLQDLDFAESMYRRLAAEEEDTPSNQVKDLLEAASCAYAAYKILTTPAAALPPSAADNVQAAEALGRFRQYLPKIHTAHTRSREVSGVYRLVHFGFLDIDPSDKDPATFRRKQALAAKYLAELEKRSEESARNVRRDILLLVAGTVCQRDDFQDRLRAGEECRKLIDESVSDPQEKARLELELFTMEQRAVLGWAYASAGKQERFDRAVRAIEITAQAVQRAKATPSTVIHCLASDSPPNSRDEAVPSFDPLEAVRAIQVESVYAINLMARYKIDWPEKYEEKRATVQSWWEEAKLLDRTVSAEAKQIYRNLVRK